LLSSLYLGEAYESSFREKISPFANSGYDLKVTALINESLAKEIFNGSFVDSAVFVLVTDLKLNDIRVEGILISEITKLNMTNYRPVIVKGEVEEDGVLISKDLAEKLSMDVGDIVTLKPIHSDRNVTLPVVGVVEVPYNRNIDVILEYPEKFRDYYANKLPMHALYGEAYIKLKVSPEKAEDYVRTISSSAVEVYQREERLQELKTYLSGVKSNPYFIASKYAGVFAAMVVVVKESDFFISSVRRFGIGIPSGYLCLQSALYLSPMFFTSLIVSLVTVMLVFGQISSESLFILIVYVVFGILSSFFSAFLSVKKGDSHDSGSL
jgi:hypothetical protein